MMASEQLFLGSDESNSSVPMYQAPNAPQNKPRIPPSPDFVPVPSSDLPPESDLVASLPVYLSKSLLETSSLHIFQYPIYPRDRPLPVPYSAAARGHKVTSRWRPKANRVEVELPLDVREEVYNTERGIEYGVGADMLAQRQARADAAHDGASSQDDVTMMGSKRVKKEKQEELQSQRRPKKLEKIKLESSHVPNATQYMVGVIRDQALHLTELTSIVQLRPSMNYLDAIDEAREAEKRRDRAALAGEISSEDENEDELIEMEAPGDGSSRSKTKKDTKKPVAQTLNVALRTEAGIKKGAIMGPSSGGGSEARDHLMAAQREADAERWMDMEWSDQHSPESTDVFNAQLFAQSTAVLDCRTKPRDYLLHSSD